MDPGDPWEKIFAGPGINLAAKIPAGKGPGNLQVHPCRALGGLKQVVVVSGRG